MNVTFQHVPPPKEPPWHEIGETLGLCRGLRSEKSRNGQWRCAQCGQMQRAESWLIWVPDGVRKSDPAWSVTEAARVTAYNGHKSGWCLSCAPKAPKETDNHSVPATDTTNIFPAIFVGLMGFFALFIVAVLFLASLRPR